MKSLALAIALEALYQETTYFSRMVGRLVTREAWLFAHRYALKNWGVL